MTKKSIPKFSKFLKRWRSQSQTGCGKKQLGTHRKRGFNRSELILSLKTPQNFLSVSLKCIVRFFLSPAFHHVPQSSGQSFLYEIPIL